MQRCRVRANHGLRVGEEKSEGRIIFAVDELALSNLFRPRTVPMRTPCLSIYSFCHIGFELQAAYVYIHDGLKESRLHRTHPAPGILAL